MFDSDILDVAIGLIFVFLLLSLVVTALQEFVAAFLKLRAKNLRHGICNLLGDALGNGIAKEVFEHPLVNGLSKAGGLPTYIPSRMFMLALLESVNPSLPGKVNDLPSFIESIRQLKNEEMQKVLTGLLQDSGGNLETFKFNIEVWYNHAMDRVIGWYKRSTQYILLGLGFGLAVLLNADTVEIARTLNASPEKRAAILEKIKAFQDNPQTRALVAGATVSTSLNPSPASSASGTAAPAAVPAAALSPSTTLGSPVPVTTATPTPTATATASPVLDKESKELNAALVEAASHVTTQINTAEGTGLFGWKAAPKNFSCWLSKLGGIAITALAISLGAPFWFDILNKFMNVRAAGKAPEEDPKKPKEHPQATGPGGAKAAGKAPKEDPKKPKERPEALDPGDEKAG